MEVGRGGISVVAGPVVVTGGIGLAEDDRARSEVPDHRDLGVAGGPPAAVATALTTVVPPWIVSDTLHVPSPAAVVVATEVAEFWSVFVPATTTFAPCVAVPVTVRDGPVTPTRLPGEAIATGVWP